MEMTISCPQCRASIPLTETLLQDMKRTLRVELDQEHQNRMESLRVQQENLEKEKQGMESLVKQRTEEKMKEEKEKLWKVAQEKAQEKFGLEFKDLKDQLAEKALKLKDAENMELALRKKARELEEKERTMALELQRKWDEEREKMIQQIKLDAQEEARHKLQEKDKQMDQLKKALEDANRKAEQGSMQVQGDAQEAHLKNVLQSAFPMDQIRDVPTGIRGADLIQEVYMTWGKKAGMILWEAKSTKAWSGDWIKKLKEDQGLVQAEVCVLVSKVMPEGVKGFDIVQGVWVVEDRFVVPVTTMIRLHLSQLALSRQSLVGQDEKMKVLYGYLTGPQFKHRMEMIVTGFVSMKEELEREKRAMQKLWGRREKELERVLENTAGMYGDLQGIAGASLPTIPSLELDGGELEALEQGADDLFAA
ncbi:MAG: hypothetical protein ACD_28C00151G0003 [uncultured bacterium]|nr:MAG: hypothetical protein ACD_28C00151G0003 [uncultured bacterium]KKT74747.1 MAG: hypothetical protein UW70_C0046G0005 [Candidatus Peregrinibacteria bacterium GW2011_GWA2_44_7]